MRRNVAALFFVLCGFSAPVLAAPAAVKILPPKLPDTIKVPVTTPTMNSLQTMIAQCSSSSGIIETNMAQVRQYAQGYRDSQARLTECRKALQRAEATRQDLTAQLNARLVVIEQANRAPAGALWELQVALFSTPSGQRGMVFFERPTDPPVVRAAKRDQPLNDLYTRYNVAENEGIRANVCVQAEPRNSEQQLLLQGSALDRCRQTLALLQDVQRKIAKEDPRLQLGLTPAEREAMARCIAAKPQCFNADGTPAAPWTPNITR